MEPNAHASHEDMSRVTLKGNLRASCPESTVRLWLTTVSLDTLQIHNYITRLDFLKSLENHLLVF